MLDQSEQGIVQRMRTYWENNVPYVDLKTLASDCARLFRLQYESHFLLPQPEEDDEGAAAPYSADAEMIHTHFLVHECTTNTRKAVLKRAYSDTFEFLQANKSNGFAEGHKGKRRPSATAEAAHIKGAMVLLKIGTYLDRVERDATTS